MRVDANGTDVPQFAQIPADACARLTVGPSLTDTSCVRTRAAARLPPSITARFR